MRDRRRLRERTPIHEATVFERFGDMPSMQQHHSHATILREGEEREQRRRALPRSAEVIAGAGVPAPGVILVNGIDGWCLELAQEHRGSSAHEPVRVAVYQRKGWGPKSAS